MFIDIFTQSLVLIVVFVIVGQLIARALGSNKENDDG